MKKFTCILTCFLLLHSTIYAQDSYAVKVSALEQKIADFKANIPKGEEKKYNVALSDIANRKNTLKAMLKTPEDKRNEQWKSTWEENYSKVNEKVNKLKLN